MISSIYLDGPSQTDEWVVVEDDDPVTQPPSRSPTLRQGSLLGTVTPPVLPSYGHHPSSYGASRPVPPTPTSISSDGRSMSLGGEVEEDDEEEVVLSGGYSPSFLPPHSLSHSFLHHQPFHNFTSVLPRKSMLGVENGSRVSPFPDPRRPSRSRSSSVGSETSTYYDAASGGLSSPPSCVSLESGSLGVVSLCDEQDRGPSSYGSTYRRWTAEALQEQDSESPTGLKGYRTQGDEEDEDEDWEEASRRTSEGKGLWGYSSPWRGGKGAAASQCEAVSRRVPERLVLEAGVAQSPPTWPYTPSTSGGGVLQSASWLYSNVLGVVGSPPVQRAARSGVCCAGQCLHYVTSKLQTLLPHSDPPPQAHHSEQDPDVRHLLRGPKPPKRSYRQPRGGRPGQWTEEANGRPSSLPTKGIALELRPMHSNRHSSTTRPHDDSGRW